MLQLSPNGLFCRAGNFHIDPKGRVQNAVITHAHSDHARRGSERYYCALPGVSLLKARLGKKISVEGIPYGVPFNIGNVQLSFHSAGHILGSAQVRMELRGRIWVVSGDYKREPDPTCEPFEVVPCDVFVTEATFGTPAYSWKRETDLGKEIYDWWCTNRGKGMNSVLFAYSLGKAQRILGVLEPYADREIYCYPTVTELNDCYRAEGVRLARTICLGTYESSEPLSGELFLVPQSFLNSPKAKLLGELYETAFASGWMSHMNGFGRGSYDRGFVMSDHADWNDLIRTVQDSKARKVYVQHRGQGALVRHLRNLGLEAFPESELVSENPNQLTLFD